MIHALRRTVPVAFMLTAVVTLATPARAQDAGPLDPELLSGLELRAIGPAVTGGRIHDVEALPSDPSTIYVASASGGLWKTTNHGTTWQPIFDDQPVSTFGDIAIAPSNPAVIWAGTGEQNNRQSTSWGNGVYRSTDGGETWTHLGLVETRHIGRVRVHPENPDIAYVAALGNLWAPSETRGVYKTTDGGQTWDKVLYIDEFTGVVDLVMDPRDANTLYAAAYQRQRRAWGFNGGGPGSGIYKTTDGGQTWNELTNGIPEGEKGRIGLALAASNPDVLYATIEHDSAEGVYRSDDAGASWAQVNELNPRPMYYSHIFVDPTDERRVYVIGQAPYRSEDGGRTFHELPSRATYDVGVHSDHHALWIDPNDPEHFYLAGDGGFHETWDGGMTFRKFVNLPIAQFYAIGVDMREPYWIYGGLQDNHSFMGPSATRHWLGILNDDWKQIGFGDGMYHQVDPTSHRYIYSLSNGGEIIRVDGETGDRLDIEPQPPAGEDYRFDWVTPALVSRHDPQVIYFGGNRLFISRDRGLSWERTEDLTRQIDRDTLELMGVPGAEIQLSRNDGTSSFGEIVTIAESPLDPAVLWVGTDDGNVQVSRDGGATWSEVARNVEGVEHGTYVSRVLASARGPGVAYATFDAHRRGDFRPYVFRTDDFGETWTPLMEGLPADGSVNVIVEHPTNPDLLFLGTEHALFASVSAGQYWTELQAATDASLSDQLPTTLFDDLVIHPRANDLIVGTHGRSLWILDDLAPLTEWSADVASADAHMFSVRPATIFQYWKDTSYRGQAEYAAENRPFGAILSYYLGQATEQARIEVADPAGEVIRSLEVPGEAGVIQRVTWDLRHEPPPSEADDDDEDESQFVALPRLPHPLTTPGPFVSPGTYTVTLVAGEARASQSVVVQGDPLMPLTAAQWQEREQFLVGMLELQRQAFDAEQRAQELLGQLEQRVESLTGEPPEALAAQLQAADSLADGLDDVRDAAYDLAEAYNGGGVQQASLYPPTETHRQERAEIETELAEQLEALEQAVAATADLAPVGADPARAGSDPMTHDGSGDRKDPEHQTGGTR